MERTISAGELIYIDVSCAVHGKAGLSRYAASLANGLRPLLDGRLRLFQNSLGRRGPLPGWEGEPVAGVPYGYKPWRGMVLARSILPLPMDGLVPDAALFHATEHLLPPLRHTPTVLTVHDLIYERFPQHHKRANHLYLSTAMPLFCRRARAILAISEATRGDLVRLYGVDPARITVIPEAAAAHFGPRTDEQIAAVRQRYGLPARYIVTVGTIEPRKNLSRLVDACGPLFRDGLVDGLVVVGSRGWLYEDFFRHLEEAPWRDRVIFPGFVDDADLPAVYAGATVTAQPSLYEGFGLPVLEAMACGSPVCTSNVSSLPEVGGDAARYFDPEDAESVTATLREVLIDMDVRGDMAQRGIRRAAEYSWERTARETLALYRRVMDEWSG
jgi:glycosyltransferase involved in cell wall biosynthesis